MIQRLWADANAHFSEIEPLVKRDEEGNLAGLWGAMSDFSRSFLPWENGFSEGLYLAGAKCTKGAEAPEGWTKWVLPASEYFYTETEDAHTFSRALSFLKEQGLALAGAVYDFHSPATGQDFQFFSVRRL